MIFPLNVRTSILPGPALLFLILLVCLMAGCRAERPTTVRPGTIGWRPIESWSGRGNAQTESFNIESGEWRIQWETRNETSPGAGRFKVMVHSAVSGRPIALAVDHRGIGRDTAYITEDPHLFHLVIESTDVEWAIKVDEAVVAAGPAQP